MPFLRQHYEHFFSYFDLVAPGCRVRMAQLPMTMHESVREAALASEGRVIHA